MTGLLAFGLLDHAIVAFYLGLTLCIGLVARRYVKGLAGYLVAGLAAGAFCPVV